MTRSTYNDHSTYDSHTDYDGGASAGFRSLLGFWMGGISAPGTGAAPILGHKHNTIWGEPTIIHAESKPEAIKVIERKDDVVLTSLSELGEVYKLTIGEQKILTAADALEAEMIKQEDITKKRLAQQMMDDDAIVMLLLIN